MGLAVLAGALALSGCGSDDDAADMHGEHLMQEDASYPEAMCPEDTPEFAIDMKAMGRDHHIVGRLVDATPAPPLIYNNDWVVAFEDAAGSPIEDVEITMARPFMPVHGHDGFYTPIVTPVDGEPGQFKVDRLNLWMRGPWLIQLTVSSESAGDDYIEFQVCIE
jgi:hypothetical protein